MMENVAEKSERAIEVTYKLADLYAISFLAWGAFLKFLLILELVYLAFIIVFPLLEGYTLAETIEYADWTLPLYGIPAAVVLWFGLCPLIGYARSRRGNLLGPHKIWLTTAGIKMESPIGESRLYWLAIKRVTTFRNCLFLFISSSRAVIVPKRAFPREEDFRAFVMEAEERWKNRSTAS